MKARDLADEVGYHLSQMEIDVRELEALRRDVGKNEPTLREVMAAGAFLGSFYNGVENIQSRSRNTTVSPYRKASTGILLSSIAFGSRPHLAYQFC